MCAYLRHHLRHLPPLRPRRQFLRLLVCGMERTSVSKRINNRQQSSYRNSARTLHPPLHRPHPQHPRRHRLRSRPSSTFWLARVSSPKIASARAREEKKID
jgi:hypothetical protein